MKLSEAIRLGAMLRPQSHIGLFFNGESCAQGAAVEANGVAFGDVTNAIEVMHGNWPWAYTTKVVTPCACRRELPVIGPFGVIAHMNDVHHWTRERIADLVATIEPQEPDGIEPEDAEHEDSCECWTCLQWFKDQDADWALKEGK